MLTSIFAEKLRKVNPNILVDFSRLNYLINQEQGTVPVYELGKWLEIDEFDRSLLDGEAKKLAVREKYYLGYIPARYIPEFEKYNPQLVCIEPGHRGFLKKLYKQRPTWGGRIRKVFGLDLDWQTDWDRQSPTKRAERQGIVLKKHKTIKELANTNYILNKDEIVEVPKNA